MARAPDVLQKGVDADVIEAEAVDERLRLRQPEQARLGIARLRSRRHRPDLDEAEAQLRQRVDVLRVLVEAGCQADRIRKLQPERPDRTGRNWGIRKKSCQLQGDAMRGFGI